MKRTTGGTFDATESPLYFVASDLGRLLTGAKSAKTLLLAVNEVRDRARLDQLLETGARVLLDSGIFNLTNEYARKYGVSMDDALTLPPGEIEGFAELYDHYVSVAKAYASDLWGVIEMDQGGAANKRVIRERIEADTGIVPMPVYHPLLDGWDYFDELCENYDRVCLGNIAQSDVATRRRLLVTMYERQRADHPDTWVHVLGFSMNEWNLSVPWYGSCDSSTWLTLLRWGDGRSHSSGERIGQMMPTILYAFEAAIDDPNGYDKASAFAAAQEGVFLRETVVSHLGERDELRTGV